jgi:hypothetical protein
MLIDDAEAPDGVDLMDFEDFDKHRQLIFDDAKTTLEKSFPKEHNGVRMELVNTEYADPEHYSLKEQKKALHEDGFLGRRLRGTVRLTDANTGELLDEKTMTLMKVPWLTERGTFRRGGNEWGSISQQRLLPGAYSRVQANGDLETQFNVRPGTGGAFRVQFNPESAQYKFNIGGSDLHLYSLMKDLGVSDDDMRARWGDAVFETNAADYDSRTLDKAYNKIVPEWDKKNNPNRTREDKIALVRNALKRSQMAAAVAKSTLPNLFSRTKSAAWREGGQLMEKCASLTKKDMQEIAIYINENSEKNIDLNASREQLLKEIRNVVATGLKDGDLTKSKLDESDDGASAVRAARVHTFLINLKKKINKPSKFLDKI